MLRRGLSAALVVTVAASVIPTASLAGVIPVTKSAKLSLATPTAQIDWRASPHRHLHMSRYYRSPRYRLAAVYGLAMPLVTVRPIYPYEWPYYTTPYNGTSEYK